MRDCGQCGLDCPMQYREVREAWEQGPDADRCYLGPTPESEKRDAEMRQKSAAKALKALAEMRAKYAGQT